MTTLRPVRRVSALALVLALSGLPVVAAHPAIPASLSGRVLGADGVSPRAGVIVELVDTRAGEPVVAATTDPDGVFRLDTERAGSYGLVARTEAGVFVAVDELALEGGANRPVALTLSDSVPSVAPGQTSASSGLPTWARWTIAGTIAVAAAFVIVETSDDEEEPVSPF